MKVNIVVPDLPHDTILYRLAEILAERNDWTINERPLPNHDLNYSIIYVDWSQRFSDWKQTPWAAYFSHFEEGTPYKEFWWQMAADDVPIKTVTADKYGAMLEGVIIKTPAPVPTAYQIFERKRPNKVKRVGISGFVDKSGRKGEKLLARLADYYDGKVDVVASGRGWPVKTQIYKDQNDLVKFYNTLDVYVCTSLIEGVPMPPLEALACGIPVVIPQGVGMLDELPNVNGIYRYERGNIEALQAAVDLALGSEHRREELRNAVAGYTPKEYALAHAKGFEEALKKIGVATIAESDRHGKRGVYYVAFGDPARKCADAAIKSFKKHLPEIPVALASSEPIGSEDVFIPMDDYDIGGRAAKIHIYDKAPKDWQYIAYLDADTEIIARETLIWDLLSDGYDMVICLNPDRFVIASNMRRSDNGDECDTTYRKIGTEEILQLNGGVFAFQRNARTKAFFETWYAEWHKYGKRDQAALLRALWQHPLRLYILGNEWNTITRYDQESRAAWLLHYPMTARRWRGVIHYRLDDPQAWRAVSDFEKVHK